MESESSLRQRKPDQKPDNEETKSQSDSPKKRRRKLKPPTIVDRSCSLLKFVIYTVMFGVFFVCSITLFIALVIPDKIHATTFNAPTPRPFTGALAPNTRLQDVERLFEGQVSGAESFAMQKGVIYTGTHDGKIIRIKDGKISTVATFGNKPCGLEENEHICGRPLGLKFESENQLLVADAYLGIFRLNVKTGKFKHLVENDRSAKGVYFKFFNDIVKGSDRTIFFTDSSHKWQRREFGYIIMENENCGRVSWFDEKTNQMDSFLNKAYFPNGMAIGPDGEYLLFCETTRFRVHKYYLKGEKAGQTETFISNLPGFPDNISPSSSGGFWIGLAYPGARSGSMPVIDFLYQHPWIRNMIAKVIDPRTLFRFIPKYGLIIEVNQKGEIVQSLHDPTGEVVSSVSEVLDTGNELYLGSFGGNYIGRLNLRKSKN
ncbi:adipocyte plasma membrane-associated protein-like [Antedon mediterranea]|uniref:adipocyte plasma membrane-associated protein-like n=1 Tax=Antedon mediterranea TaxID=105859 RepID=UPI003AF9B519